MNKIDPIGMQRSQLQLMQEMQRMASMSGSSRLISSAAPVLDNTFNTMNRTDNLSFSQVMNRAIDGVNSLQQVASAKQAAVDMGISDDLTGTMLESQKASVAFSAMVQVRNKLTSALDEVMNIAL